MAKRVGPIPCLDAAVEAMRSATTELQKNRLAPASGFQETALAELIKARQNMRQMLSESSSASSCRQVDNQQRQKLRPPQQTQRTKQEDTKPKQSPPEKEPQPSKELQERIEKLAQSQRTCASQCSSPASSSSRPSSSSQSSSSQSSADQASARQPSGEQPEPQSAQSTPLGGKTPGEKPAELPAGQTAIQSPGAKSGQKPTPGRPEELAERQQQAAAEAGDIERQMRQDKAMTDLACRRMSAAGQAIRDSAAALRSGRPQQAGQQAAEAAEQLERLSRQVAGLKAEELAEKLTAAASLANQLARQQQQEAQESSESFSRDPTGSATPSAGQPGAKPDSFNRDPAGSAKSSAAQRAARPDAPSSPDGAGGKEASPDAQAGRQRDRAEDARTLGDLLQQVQHDAREADARLADALREAAEANPPTQLAEQMEQAAQALQAGRPQQAQNAIRDSAQRLDALAQQVDAVRRGFVQPHLERLLAAEKQAAELQQELQKPGQQHAQSEIPRRMDQLEQTLEGLGRTDEKLNAAATRFSDAVHRRAGPAPEQTATAGYSEPDQLDRGAVQRVIRDLQVRIQEIVLTDALLDQDEPVPPQYRKPVEAYYRVLSEDLSGDGPPQAK